MAAKLSARAPLLARAPEGALRRTLDGLLAVSPRGIALVCIAYIAVLSAAFSASGTLLLPWMALPVLLAAAAAGLRAALLSAVGLAAATLLMLLWRSSDVDGLLLALTLPSALAAAALGLTRDRIKRESARTRQSSERYELAARGSGDGLFEWELGSGHVYYSETFAQLLGYAPTELGATSDDWFSRVHSEDLPSLRAEIDQHIAGESAHLDNEHRIRRKDGSWLWVLTRAIAARDEQGKAQRLAGWLTDIHDRKRSEDQLRHHAFHDALTGLPNRALFMDRLTHALARARRTPSHRFAIVLLDLDRFKLVNDSLGHVAGDELLVWVGQRLESCLRPGDTVARLGGDEFMLLLEDVKDSDDARGVAERIQRALSLPLPLGGHDVVATASIGIAVGDGGILEPHELLRDADTAMYEAKARGSGQLVSFDARMHDRAVERLNLESALRCAIERGELSVSYQPIVELKSGTILGFEALARWRHPSLGDVAPIRFIPLAEETGMIGEIGAWVLTQAATQARRLMELFPARPPLTMHVNMSVRQMQQDLGLLDRVDRALALTQLPPELLTVEVTESVIMEDSEKGERLLGALRKRGIRVCMDDFGTGYSSLSYLHRFRVDSLKIDISFVRNLTEPSGRSEIVKTILTLAQTLGLSVVAEGIETREQLNRLIELGCLEGQGFLFSPPVDAASIESLLRHPPHW
jgi:diguanylate cyclase (GGDEF)-like protein/PAS domain S-box-containing protein